MAPPAPINGSLGVGDGISTPENAHKILYSVCSGEMLPENLKIGKRGRKVLNLISFELGALGGKLMLIPYLF
jgi:hypothetical protein